MGPPAGWNASVASAQVLVPSLTQNLTTFYWVYPDNSLPVTYSYCLNNLQCSPSSSATFDVTGPPAVNVETVVDQVRIYTDLGDRWMGLGDGIDNAGISFAASPAGAQGGTYLWVQLVKALTTKYLTSTGQQQCTVIQNDPELDNVYPNDNGPFTSDSPNTSLPPSLGDLAINESFSRYLMWDPTLPSGCTAATPTRSSTCTSIPVPLGYVSWNWTGGAINTLWTQTGDNGTTWKRNCGAGSAASFRSALPSDPFSGYPTWTHTVLNGPQRP